MTGDSQQVKIDTSATLNDNIKTEKIYNKIPISFICALSVKLT